MLNRKTKVLIRGFKRVLRSPFSCKGTSLPIPNYTQGAISI